jgi:hypothetical protein
MKINPKSPKKCSMFQLNEMGNKKTRYQNLKKRKNNNFPSFLLRV